MASVEAALIFQLQECTLDQSKVGDREMKNNRQLLITLLLALVIIVAGCDRQRSSSEPVATIPATTVAVGQEVATPQAENLPVSCPETTDDLQRLYNPQHGYCLLYPVEYKVEKPSESETVLVIGGLLNAGDPRVHIVVEPAGDRTTETVADQIAAEYPPEFGIERHRITVGGEAAEVLDLLPGQDINRRVIFTHEGLLYALMFSPVLDSDNQPNQRLESFYSQILETFTFIPQSDAMVEDCLTAGAGTQLVKSEAFGYCLLLSDEYESEQPNDAEMVFFVDSLMDVEHPKLFITIENDGRTVTQAVEELISSFPADFGIQSTGGVTAGYEPAERLDNVPGQDISRVIFVEHDGQLYKLTFVPASEDAGEVYQQMELLYELVIRSFRFLPKA
jgi:hypothetical protein